MRRGHAQGLCELGQLGELEREPPGAPTNSGKRVAATGRDTRAPALTVMAWAGVALHPAENGVVPDPWAWTAWCKRNFAMEISQSPSA